MDIQNPSVSLSRGRKPKDHKVIVAFSRFYENADQRFDEVEMTSGRARRLFEEGLRMCDAIDTEHHNELARSMADALNMDIEVVKGALARVGLQLLDPLVHKPGIPQP